MHCKGSQKINKIAWISQKNCSYFLTPTQHPPPPLAYPLIHNIKDFFLTCGDPERLKKIIKLLFIDWFVLFLQSQEMDLAWWQVNEWNKQWQCPIYICAVMSLQYYFTVFSFNSDKNSQTKHNFVLNPFSCMLH